MLPAALTHCAKRKGFIAHHKESRGKQQISQQRHLLSRKEFQSHFQRRPPKNSPLYGNIQGRFICENTLNVPPQHTFPSKIPLDMRNHLHHRLVNYLSSWHPTSQNRINQQHPCYPERDTDDTPQSSNIHLVDNITHQPLMVAKETLCTRDVTLSATGAT